METAEDLKRGPGRPLKIDETFTLAYIPRDPGDPGKTTCYGMEFTAGVPVTLKKIASISAPIRQETITADGNIVSKSPERKVAIYELARNNPYFSVDGEVPFKSVAGKSRLPDDPDRYRGHFYTWVAQETDLDALNARWDAEAPLRETCGVDEGHIKSMAWALEAFRQKLSS